MAYRIERRESVEAGLKRIVREQIDKALAEIADGELDRHDAVHQVRKRCKKIRGALRLVRPALGDVYRAENAAFRDLARSLSALRDAQVLRETYDLVAENCDETTDRQAMGRIRRQLTMRLKHIADGEQPIDERLKTAVTELRQAAERVDAWELSETGFTAIEGGLKKTYRRARRAMDEAYDDPAMDAFHEWRKRVKYHWHHVRLLRMCRRRGFKARSREARELGTLLGDHHNLCVLDQTIRATPEAFGDNATVALFLEQVGARCRELETRARPLGEKLFAEKPKSFVKRVRAYWHAWR